MASTAVTASPSRDAIRDPVLLVPLVVAVGLSIGWLGVHERVSGTRVAADVALSWALVAASVVMLERPRWRRTRWLLAATAFALLGADLEWAGPHVVWTLGFVLEGLWAALLLQVVLTFPEGRPWSRTARVTIVGAYAVTFGVVTGIMWSRLHRPEASKLVVELRTGATTSLRERLARALGDPTLDVAYRLGDGRYVDATGHSIELPQGLDRAVTTVTAGGEEVAALVHDPALLDEPALVESVRATAGLVLDNERLAAEVRSQLAEVHASRGRIVAAADAERRRIERNLHDGAQQRLVTLTVALGLEASHADAATADVLSRAQEEVEQAIAELRELARGIHPTLLRDEGLGAAVEALARRASLPVTVHGTVRGRLPDSVELAAYFVASEA